MSSAILAASLRLAPSRKTRNSSPPNRATMSLARNRSWRIEANVRRTASPTVWPCFLLKLPKWSRSNRIAATGRRSADVEAVAGGQQPLQRRVEVASVEQAGQRVADGGVGHLGVQLGVGDRERDVAGDDRQDLLLELGSTAASRSTRKTASAPSTASSVSSGHRRRRHDVGELAAADRGRERGLLQVRVDDEATLGDRPPGDAFALRDPDADEALVAALHRRDPVVAEGRVACDQRDDVAAHDRPERLHDDRVQLVRVERGIDGSREAGQGLEQLRALGDGLVLPAEGDRRRQSLGDQDHRGAVAVVEAVDPRILDVQDAEQFARGHERRGDLAQDVALRDPVVGIVAHVADERGLARAHDATDDPGRAVEALEDRLVPALCPELDGPVVLEQVDRDVLVPEPAGHQVHQLLERGRRRAPGKQVPDGFDAGHLAGPATLAAARLRGRDRSRPRGRRPSAG